MRRLALILIAVTAITAAPAGAINLRWGVIPAAAPLLTLARANRLTRQYLTAPSVRRIHVQSCKQQAWFGDQTIRCNVAWQQHRFLQTISDVRSFVRVRIHNGRAQCSLADFDWQRCKHAQPFAPFGFRS